MISSLGTYQGLKLFPKALRKIKSCVSTVLNFFVEHFVSKNGVLKNVFPIVFSKSNFGWGDSFLPTFLSEKAKHPRFSGNVSEI